ncbi:helix-turn-helix domain-containing protein [candidate division WWE3 bacterium]|nr:helix-turn-helix domain-containing protein [candidate division WWE3 bacterium]
MNSNPGKQIKNLRKEQGLSQSRFGQKIGISGKTVSAYETGKVVPPLKVLEKISDTYCGHIKAPNIKTKKMILERLQKIRYQMKEIEELLGGRYTSLVDSKGKPREQNQV